MKSVNFFAFSLLAIANFAAGTINLSVGIMRNESATTAANVVLELNERTVCYQDEQTYVEAEMLEESAAEVVIEFTIATKNDTGAFMVRGLPKLAIPMVEAANSASLRCDGPGESFMLMATVHKLEEPAVVAPAA